MAPLFLYLHTYSLRFHLAYKPGYDVFSFIDQAAAEGFAGVCISANDANYRHLGGNEPARLARIRDALQRRRLRCDMDTSGTQPDHLYTMLHVAQAIGAQQLRTYTRYRRETGGLVARTITDLRQLASTASALKVRILLENHETFTGREIAQILQAVNSPWIGTLYDYGNSQMVMEDPLHALASMAPYAGSAHLKDHVMLRPEDSPDSQLSVLGVPIGQGYLPIVEITRRLLAAGLERIAFENCWGYRSPVKSQRLTPDTRALLGRGSFRFARPPLTNERYLLYPDRFTPSQLVQMEAEAHTRSLSWLRQALSAASIQLAR